MTRTGQNRVDYSFIEPAPSRFYETELYAEWCVRADEWAANRD